MKHYTITSDTEAAALRPFASDPLKVGHIITPSVGSVTHTAWEDYPEADALTFEQCMSIVKDEVTEHVLREVGGELYFEHPKLIEGEKRVGFDLFAEHDSDACIEMGLSSCRVLFNGIEIYNPTATKIKLLAAILRGENI
jgi:hypothetical protein